ncbi:MAG TPA: nucleotidyltransferase domain-containing protein [Planctomycetota bacterium]|nr:nucleotidyltransferase domain-containing protein [Planctomycetota bacterium]
MVPVIEQNRDELLELCRRFKVRRLELFGSAAAGEGFRAHDSDLDFLVEFLPLEPGTHADAYFGLLAALEDLLGRPVDLVMTRAITNPYFLESVNRTRRVVYAA